MKFIDLSVAINKKTPVYPGDPKTVIDKCGILQKDGYQDHYVSIGTHAGTHVDAPSHMLKGGKNIDQISLEQFSGRGVYIKTGKQIKLQKIEDAPIQGGDFVLLYTGMSDVYFKSDYYDSYPDIPEDVIHYLVSKKVKAVGVDMCSIDHEPFPMHKILLKNNILIIENLTNLEALNGKEFKIYAFPLKLEIDGSPARVVAEIK